METGAIRKCAHDLVNRFQVALSLLESERCTCEHHRRAEREIRSTIRLAHHLQELAKVLEEGGTTK